MTTAKNESSTAIYDDVAHAAWTNGAAPSLETADDATASVDPRFFTETGVAADDDAWESAKWSNDHRRRGKQRLLFMLAAGIGLTIWLIVSRQRRQMTPAERIKAKAMDTAHSFGSHGKEFATNSALHSLDLAEHSLDEARKRIKRAIA